MAAIDVPGVFLHADSDDHIIMVFKGKIALLMCHVDPKLYREVNYIRQDRQNCSICESIEGSIRTATKCTPILPQIGQVFSEIWT